MQSSTFVQNSPESVVLEPQQGYIDTVVVSNREGARPRPKAVQYCTAYR